MKIISSLPLLFLFFSNAIAQTVNDIPIKDIDAEYIRIVGTQIPFTSKISVEVDFGQEDNPRKRNYTAIRDEYGKLMAFNSMIDALNFMSKNGYDFVDVFTISSGDQSICHYLMRKRKNEN